MAQKRESFFWTSYSDMMTSLFFIMLTLFVLTIVLLGQRMRATERELAHIKAIEQSTRDLSGRYFFYNEEYEKYVLRIDVFFPELQSDFGFLSAECKDSLDKAGDEIAGFMRRHSDGKYLLIVEGQASANSEAWTDRNYQLSFDRAKNLMRFWLADCHKDFGDNCEVQIAGSGDGRLNIKSMRNPVEVRNQRFLIYIIPKNIIPDEN